MVTTNKFGSLNIQTGGFEQLTQLEQEEIDNILKDNDISPLKSNRKDKTQKLVFESNYNFDYVAEEDDEMEYNLSDRNNQNNINDEKLDYENQLSKRSKLQDSIGKGTISVRNYISATQESA